jgi:hypothetical protein
MQILGALWAGWKKFAHRLGIINTTIVLTIVFVMLAPVALVRRLFGADRLGRTHAPGKSMWRSPEPAATDVDVLAAHRRQF